VPARRGRYSSVSNCCGNHCRIAVVSTPPSRILQTGGSEITVNPTMSLQKLIAIVAAFPLSTLSAQEGTAPSGAESSAAEVREKVGQWVLTEKTRSAEAADWEEQKRSMADLNELRRKEITQLDGLIAASGTRLTDLEREIADLKGEAGRLESAREEMERRIVILEENLRTQIPMFPPPLRDSIAEALSRLRNPEPDTPLQNRFRDSLLVLGAASQFHRELTIDTEVRDLGGERVEVDILYLGFSGAWYVDRSGKWAGSGRPGADGWEWKTDDGIAEKVREAIAMYYKKAAPGFVGLPFEPGESVREKR
jgi:hypothetical protein